MSDLKRRATINRPHDVKDYIKDTPVKIAKGSLKGCTGKISSCTVIRIYIRTLITYYLLPITYEQLNKLVLTN